ncbi:hypothetical protein CJF31_00005640 [Rutstroemia sp. NJR-2017a BVV2]|nr:hypothetical protein CJF31_00005640 [Rutstroemia sp. NJR-2017a BVV2]
MPEFNAFKDEEVKDLEAQNHHGPVTEPENKDAETRREEPAIPSLPAESPTHIEAQRENSTVSHSFGESEPLPPLHTPHRRRQTIMWVGLVLITLDLCCLPITYYYALNFGTSLPLQDSEITSKFLLIFAGLISLSVFAIITSVYGMISFAHYGLRSLKLFRAKTAPRWRPVGWSRWGMVSYT